MVFDVLRIGGRDLGHLGYRDRRRILEQVPLEPPLAVTPATDDPEQAYEWFHAYAPAGVEGIVAKGASQRYVGDQRGWLKYRHRRTTEAIVGAVDGTLRRPTRLVLAAWDDDARLRVVGATGALSEPAARQASAHLRPAGPDHPWADQLPGHLLGGLAGQHGPTQVEPVVPDVVAEIAVDTAFDRGRWRHPARFQRIRTDINPAQVTVEHIASA